MALFDLSGKTAVVTGGGSGIGKSIAQLFAQQGAHVFILELNAEAGEETIREITTTGAKATLRTCNVAKQAEVLDVFAGIEQEVGTIDILINNAGIAHVGNLENTAEEDIDRIYAVNIKGMYNCMLAAVKSMKKANKGVITNMASVAGSLGIPDRFAYSMSKGAVIAMTYSVARDYLTSNIRCNCISPGRVHTPFVDGFIAKNYPGQEQEMFEKLSKTQPIGRMGTPNEIAHLALYLSSEEASFITGTDYPIDGGFITLNS
ncbi:SDR family NAD(P)-dependent oxidoreductase [Adhaeribacter pallidiroseus]|uniref:Gluconate 5-dehydrogenase n=1 Tax=Adhaeribacter pallidiroseus TaxID=2072847 RepID=A0A369QRV6_9BACT|nr:glucose 1-dehydrogenase [Adhaeribacter pallidiroseus]RDC64918.1 Gluconate 5-dehydrogenase [Adhaeribacter pallidiroseus]